MQVGIQRTEKDIGHVERAERSLLKDRGELIAVAVSPARRVEAKQQGDQGTIAD